MERRRSVGVLDSRIVWDSPHSLALRRPGPRGGLMNAADIVKYGQGTALQAVEGLPEADWATPGVCGVWSVKDIIAHLASYEQVLAEVLESITTGGATPLLDRFT